MSLVQLDPDPKSCAIQKQNSGMIVTPLSGGCADEKVTIHRRDRLSLPWSRLSWVRPCRMSTASWVSPMLRFTPGARSTAEFPFLNSNTCGRWKRKICGWRGWLLTSASIRPCCRTYWQKRADAGTPARMDQGFTGPIRCQRKTNLFCAATQPQLAQVSFCCCRWQCAAPAHPRDHRNPGALGLSPRTRDAQTGRLAR